MRTHLARRRTAVAGGRRRDARITEGEHVLTKDLQEPKKAAVKIGNPRVPRESINQATGNNQMTIRVLRILAAALGLIVAADAASAADAPAFIYLQCSDGKGATVFTEPGAFSGDVNAAETKTALSAKLAPVAKGKGVECTSTSLQVIGPFATEADAKKDRADMISFQGGGTRVVLVPYPN